MICLGAVNEITSPGTSGILLLIEKVYGFESPLITVPGLTVKLLRVPGMLV